MVSLLVRRNHGNLPEVLLIEDLEDGAMREDEDLFSVRIVARIIDEVFDLIPIIDDLPLRGDVQSNWIDP